MIGFATAIGTRIEPAAIGVRFGKLAERVGGVALIGLGALI